MTGLNWHPPELARSSPWGRRVEDLGHGWDLLSSAGTVPPARGLGDTGPDDGGARLRPEVRSWVSVSGMERLRAKGTGRSVTRELEKSVMTWIWLQSSTRLTFNLPGAAGTPMAGVCVGSRLSRGGGGASARGEREPRWLTGQAL